MGVLIRVEDVPPRSRLDYFRHAVADTFVPFDLRIDADHDLRAQILTRARGDPPGLEGIRPAAGGLSHGQADSCLGP
jgi:hypothetical protein